MTTLCERIAETTDPVRRRDLVDLNDRITATRTYLSALEAERDKLLRTVDSRGTGQAMAALMLDGLRRMEPASDYHPTDDLSQESLDRGLAERLEQDASEPSRDFME